MVSGFKVFYQNAVRQMKTTGSIAPSSRYLASAITRCVDRKDQPLRILEAGPGTGPFTRLLAKKLGEGDQLDLCELNPTFVKYLDDLCKTHPDFCARPGQIQIFNKPLQELEGEHSYDYIVSGLPLNNFDPALVEDIFHCFERLIKPGGKLAFFEYYLIRHLRRLLVDQTEKERIVQREKILNSFLSRYRERTVLVPLNLPPSVVYVCQM